MIAQPDRHYEQETLRHLLDEHLPRDQADQVESHISHCASCRKAMEAIAGEEKWWDETVQVLGEPTLLPAKSPEVVQTLDASLDWVRPLLDESSGEGVGRIDKYQVQGVIGQGGMGVVLRGIDPELNRPVAIKVLAPHLAGVGAARVRFMREAQAAAAVVHPSIVPIYSVATSARLPYIVMPCINGGNLQQRIDREGPLDLSEVLRIGSQIAEGLAAAHRHGVIHRDIKPANILIEEGNGRALISDFGLARALDDATLTISGMIAGTPQFMSPEQARGDAIDARTDLFSLGSLLYALSTGRPPFRAESPLVVLRKITETEPRPVGQIVECIPDWFEQLVARLMQKDVGKRIDNAKDAAELIRGARAHLLNPGNHELPRPLARPHSIGRRFPMLIAMTVLVAMTCLVVAGAGLKHRFAATDGTAESAASHEESDLNASLPAVVPHDDASPSDSWLDDAAEQELLAIQSTLDQLTQSMNADSYPFPLMEIPTESTQPQSGEEQ